MPPGRLAARTSTPISRSFVAHLAWSALVLAAAGGIAFIELSSACPPGGPLDFGTCSLRSFSAAVLGLAAMLYVAALSGVLAWTSGLRHRGLADARATRDWYLLAAVVGLPASPLLAFTLLSALR